ncbi:cardiolipin synthase [Bacillus mesophilus]|uniref:Cardiolipin synthase n=1 Tax=Bacillus mesophilus TaxID=1808955 RepID=A0A6M0Q324_9BACI|nr:cardiolipin synthase [Bacillus mesophilus]MBM7659750.1 cardiolipin synthase [Bacillus mesophilus]NEY70612.1 cardiolipin synthase [Bacillus mesophilus]
MKQTIQVLLYITFVLFSLYSIQTYTGQKLIGVISIVFTLLAIFTGFVIFLENRNPTKTITWLIVLGIFPVIGFFFYILFGRNFRKKKMFQRKAINDEEKFQELYDKEIRRNKVEYEHLSGHQERLFRLAQRLGKSPITKNTYSEVLTNGDETYSKIIKGLQEANQSIHLEYYIVRDDEIGNKIKEILIEKAKAGVEVRFLYDSVGSWRLTRTYINSLKEAGVKMAPFSPVKLPFLNHKVNFRNHRKIIVVDGKIGFVGGLNIGDEYLGRNKYFGFWRDTHLFLEGEAVRSLQIIFLKDWYYTTNEALKADNYLNPTLGVGNDLGGVQLVAGGPDHEWEVIKNLFFEMISSARKSICIATPYLIPDVDILSALKIASLSGVDVKIIVPNRPDKKIVFYASRSYFPELLEAGVEVYEYEKGFMHSKFIIIDDEIASIGTSNMDMRSFHLNFEVNAFLYQTNSIQRLVKVFKEDLEHSKVVETSTFNTRSIIVRVTESLSRLLSPLL